MENLGTLRDCYDCCLDWFDKQDVSGRSDKIMIEKCEEWLSCHKIRIWVWMLIPAKTIVCTRIEAEREDYEQELNW